MLKKNLLSFLFNLIKYKLFYFDTKYFGDYSESNVPTSLSEEIGSRKKIVIYGFGPYGEEYFVKLFDKYRILGVYDRNYDQLGKCVEPPDLITRNSFDYVIVTVMNERVRKSIVNFLLEKGITKNRIVFVEYND